MSDNLVLVALLFLLTSNSTINSTQLFLLLALLTTTNCSNLLGCNCGNTSTTR